MSAAKSHAVCLATGCTFEHVDTLDYAVDFADRHTDRTGHTVIVRDWEEPPC